jgi:DNA polymerase I-like protein with 3'-5' exonuclease and polymerase domains
MDLITFDAETYYDKEFSLTKLTTEAYIKDPRFELIGFSIKVNDGKPRWFTGDMEHYKRILGSIDWSDTALLAHNTAFDAAILSFLFDIHPAKLMDTMCIARAQLGVDESVSLANLAKHYGVGEKGTEVIAALGKHRADFTPAELKQYGVYCKNDVQLTYDIFNRQMSTGFPTKELSLIDLTLRMFTQPRLELDETLLQQHLKEVQDTKVEHLFKALNAIGEHEVAAKLAMQNPEALDHAQKILRSNDKFAAALEMLDVIPPLKTSPTTGKATYAFAKTDDGFKALQEHEDPRVQTLAAARLGVKTTIEESRTERFIDISRRGGTLPVPLKYAGARTFRWSADGSINMQNTPRTSTLKRAIRAPQGYVIVGSDLSNIELRVGLWFAGQMDKLQQLGEGRDLYKDFASKVFAVGYDDVTKDQRFIGKTSQLSLIYGVGANKLRQAIKTGSGTDIGETESKRIVDMYRTEYALVKGMWDDGEHALKSILHNMQRSYGNTGLIKVMGRDGCLMPSGLHMRYPQLTQVSENGKKQWVYTTRKGKEHLYGAKFFQGLVQGIARCVMGEQMIRIAKKYPLLLTVHDAVYILAREDEAQDAKEFVLAQMRQAPKWIPGIPLDAEADFGPTLADC